MRLTQTVFSYLRGKSRGVAAVLQVGIVASFPLDALAWGEDGHRTIAEIAEQYLAATTAARIRELLATENVIGLAAVSMWADYIRLQRPDTAPWHYVNIPVHPAAGTAAKYDPARDCAQDNCIVAKIAQFKDVLRDDRTLVRQRVEALKFVVHFVGDIHQPLHFADDHDRGGNAISLEFSGRSTNLHAVWDTGILAPIVQGADRPYALRLTQSIRSDEAMHWEQSGPIEWANESYLIAAQVIYDDLPHESGILPVGYEIWALPIIEKQLQKAGVRLAKMLNETLP